MEEVQFKKYLIDPIIIRSEFQKDYLFRLLMIMDRIVFIALAKNYNR